MKPPDGRDVVLLDGAMGTELSRRGCDTGLPLWSARALEAAPDLVEEIHRDFLRAGCRVLTTCTFRTHERSLAAGGWPGLSDALNARAVELARRAIATEASQGILVAGSLSPLEDCFLPDDVPPDEELASEHAEQAASLARAGVDVILVETMNSGREAEAAVRAGVDLRLPVWCSFVTQGGRLLSGEPLDEIVGRVQAAGADAVLVNCVPVSELADEVLTLRSATALPIGGYGNVGHDRSDGFRPELMVSPEDFATASLEAVRRGATLVGGCCGTEPRHLAALAAALGQ